VAEAPPEKVEATAEAVDEMAALIAGAVAEAAGAPEPLPETAGAETQVAEATDELAEAAPETLAAAATEDMTLVEEVAALAPPPQGTLEAQAAALDGTLTVAGLGSSQRPPKRNAPIFDDVTDVVEAAAEPEVVVSVSTSGDRHWGINVGSYPSSYHAERALLQVQLAESATLNASLRKVLPQNGGFDATFVGLTQEQADLACRRLQARAMQCFTMGPG
jgi:D-alanyl-D-alanine carboxypeptidase